MSATSSYVHLMSNKSTTAVLTYIIYFICLLPAGIFALKRPHYNWDMLPYMALVLRMEHPDINVIHKMTYKSAKEDIPTKEYELLLTGDYRKKMAESPSSFQNQLPFYVVKPIYIGFVYLFYKSGVSLPTSTVLPSIMAYFLIGALLFHWLGEYFKSFYAFAGSLLIMYSSYMISLERISSPDCLSALFLFAAMYFIIEKPSVKLMFLFLILAIFTRIDNIVMAIIIISFLAFSRMWKKGIIIKQYLTMVSIIIACYFSITFLTTAFNWDIFYYPTFATSLDLSRKFHSTFPIREYLSLMYSKVITAIVFSHITTFLLLVLMILFPWAGQIRKFTFDQLFVLLLVFIILIRFMLFPDLSDRFYTAFYLAIIMQLVRKISRTEYIQNKSHA